MTKILTAKPLAKQLYAQIKSEIALLNAPPKMAVIVANDDAGSKYYVQSIVKRAAKLAALVDIHSMPPNASQIDILKKIEELNADTSVDGIMLQKPLPELVNDQDLVTAMLPTKDVDGLHPLNMGKLMLGQEGLVPCTPAAVLAMLDFYQINPAGKNVVIIGRSDIIGKPLANLLLQKSPMRNATVTVCHSRTIGLAKICQSADILIAAIGRAKFVTAQMLPVRGILIDVGVNQIKDADGNNVYVGDIDYDVCMPLAGAITPVPGGIGSITTAVLFMNLLKAKKMANNLS